MDKKTFLEELRSSLSVLQETELNDIMDEYEQHIDMKVQSGLTEEEAIAEFGNRKELTAEILEAYHVRADYEAGQNGSEKREAKEKISLWSRVVQLWDSERRAVKRQILRCRDWFHKLFGKQKAAVSREKEKRAQRNGREDGTAQSGCMNSVSQKINRMSRRTGNLFSRLFAQSVRMISWCCRHIWTTALWCVKAGWNVLWIFFALLCGGFGLLSLFGLGVLAVLLCQGYPLAGAAIGALGVNLSLFSAAGLGLTFLWRRERNGENGEKRSAIQEEEEENYV